MVRIGIPLRYTTLENGRNILFINEALRRTIQKAGGFIIPIVQVQDVNHYDTRYNEFDVLTDFEKDTIEEYLNMVDGVIFPGGEKITPFDRYLLDRCIMLDKKVLVICLGMQLMSCYGSVFKTYKNDSYINHCQEIYDGFVHKVSIKKNTKLWEIIGSDEIEVNSFHNYHVENIDNYSINAISEDGYIEGVELKNCTFNIGVQWHPEISYDFDENSRKIIDYFISICGKN